LEDTKVWIERALDDCRHLKSEFIASQKWVVVPVESGLHFDERDAERIAWSARRANQATLRAVLLEKLKDVEDNVPVKATKEGLLAFNKQYGHFNCVLVPPDFSFAIVCSTDDYYLVAGRPDFVRSAFGVEISEASEKFAEFARNEAWSAEDRARLLGVHARYSHFEQGNP